MDANNILNEANTKFNAFIARFNDDLKSLRTGRANAAMLDGVLVEAYGSSMPLNQVATVSAVDAQLIQITPFDPNNIEAINTAIRNNPTLGLNPSDDGRVVRVPIPPLTEERRRELAKVVGEKVEECLVKTRGIRHDALNSISQFKKDKKIGEDDAKRYEKQIDEAMSKHKVQIEALARAKEEEIMKI